MEAILTSRRDLAKTAQRFVRKAGIIDIFLRFPSLRWAVLTQTSAVRFMSSRP